MGSKKYKDKTCVYCQDEKSQSGDHIFAREFFLDRERENLPQVPSCTECNNTKSNLEHYATIILPFGASHKTAHENMTTMPPKRINKNKKLHVKLITEMDHKLIPTIDATTKQITLPIDFSKIERLFSYIAKGLMWYHFKTLSRKDYEIKVLSLTSYGDTFFDREFMENEKFIKLEKNLGDNAIAYTGAINKINPHNTAWKIQLFGGITLIDDAATNHLTKKIGIITGDPDYLHRLGE